VDNIDESTDELKAGNDELTAMMLRAAYRALSTIEQQNVDEQILQRIFSRFCVGK
jgi:tRNA U34 5-carboxymethylaminomethyl modifying GTPase MnmE/TrmE